MKMGFLFKKNTYLGLFAKRGGVTLGRISRSIELWTLDCSREVDLVKTLGDLHGQEPQRRV